MQNKLKIYISYHDDFEIIRNEIYTPIHVGRKTSNKKLDMIGDDSGDNISLLNNIFCELTSQYWAWKNDTTSEYIGFCHYRRFFYLNKNYDIAALDDSQFLHFDSFSDEFFEESKLLQTDILIKELASDVLVLPRKINTIDWGSRNIIDQVGTIPQLNYRFYSKTKLFEDLLEAYKTAYPDFVSLIDEVMYQQDYGYFYNIFIMKKSLFDDYCNWLFPILLKFNEKVDYTEYSVAEKRSLAFFAERLLNIYIKYLVNSKKINQIKEIPVVMIDAPEKKNIIFTSQSIQNKRPILIEINNDNYLLGMTTIKSLLKNIQKLCDYHLFILETGSMSLNKKKKINDLLQNRLSYQYHKPSFPFEHKKIDNYTMLSFLYHFQFEKICMLKAGTVVLKDLDNLFLLELNGKALLASNDISIYKKTKPNFEYERYISEILNTTSREYINDCVLVCNTLQIDYATITKQIKEIFDKNYYISCKDILNYIFKNNIQYLGYEWSFDILIDYLMIPDDLSFLHKQWLNSPNIIILNLDLLHNFNYENIFYNIYEQYYPLNLENFLMHMSYLNIIEMEQRITHIEKIIEKIKKIKKIKFITKFLALLQKGE